MNRGSLIYLFLKTVVNNIEKKHDVGISDLIGYVSTRPFNMKGQEFEELICYPLKKEIALNDEIQDFNIDIETNSNKGKTDISLLIDSEKYDFSIKNYTTHRFQITTLAKKLTYIKNKFEKYTIDSVVRIDKELHNEIIEMIKKDLEKDITIFALTHKIARKPLIDIYLMSIKLDFFDKIDYMEAKYSHRKKTAHRRIGFFIKGHNEMPIMSLDLGTNAFNRGLRGENGKYFVHRDTIRESYFYSFLKVKEKNISEFEKITNDEKNDAIINIIKKAIDQLN